MEMMAPAARASPSTLPLLAFPTASFIWLGIVITRIAVHMVWVENQKKLMSIRRELDRCGRMGLVEDAVSDFLALTLFASWHKRWTKAHAQRASRPTTR